MQGLGPDPVTKAWAPSLRICSPGWESIFRFTIRLASWTVSPLWPHRTGPSPGLAPPLGTPSCWG